MKLCDVQKCTGCMACYNSCKFDAISLSTDETGMLFPKIEEDKCRECGCCTKACPILTTVKRNNPRVAYAAYTNNEFDRRTCASGGVATAFTRHFFDSDGSVFGSKFDDRGQLVVSKVTTDIDIEKLKGSKYIYSFPGSSYKAVENDLKAGKNCLFIGTPCQVAGLKSFLKKEYDRLLTVDLICHGTPPLTYFDEYLNYLRVQREGIKVQFRGENGFRLYICDKFGKKILSHRYEEDLYFHAFIKGLIYREPCYECSYACQSRVSDITIGDFWGLEDGALNGYKGRKSVVLINTAKADEFWEKIKNQLIYEKRSVEEAIQGNEQLRKPSSRPIDRNLFLKVYKTDGFVKAVKSTNLFHEILKYKVKNRILYIPRIIKHKLLCLKK